jgi:hypothetical protein
MAGLGFHPGGNWLLFVLVQPETGKNVIKPPAIETDHGLHGAVNAGVRATANARLILAMRTLELERPAHVFEIQLWPQPGNPAFRFKSTRIDPPLDLSSGLMLRGGTLLAGSQP